MQVASKLDKFRTYEQIVDEKDSGFFQKDHTIPRYLTVRTNIVFILTLSSAPVLILLAKKFRLGASKDSGTLRPSYHSVHSPEFVQLRCHLQKVRFYFVGYFSLIPSCGPLSGHSTPQRYSYSR